MLVAVIGAGFHGLVLGRWQWRILATRMPGLPRRQRVIATLVLVVWLFVIAPGAVDILAQGGDTLAAFKSPAPSAAPTSWATTKPGTDAGAMLAKVLVRIG